MNLILIKELYQEKVNFELLKNVLVKLIIIIMQLNIKNNQNELQILQKYKLENNYNNNKINM